MMLKESFFMNGSDNKLRTAEVSALHDSTPNAPAFSVASSRGPARPTVRPVNGSVNIFLAAPLMPLCTGALFLIGAALCVLAGDVSHSNFAFSSHYQAVVGVVLELLALWLLPPVRGWNRSHRRGPEDRRSQPVGRRAAAPPVPPFGRISGPVPVSPAVRLQVVPIPVTTC